MEKTMKVIGLTGPSGAGKGVCDIYFQEHGISYIDTDKVYHDLLLPPSACAMELACQFGSDIIRDDQTLDRSKLASIVFSDVTGNSLQKLNEISHRYVKEKTLSLLDTLRSQGARAAVVDAPLLFEASFDSFCDFTIAILADRDIRLQRIMSRDSLSREKALERICAQKDDQYYISRANYTLYNNQDQTTLYQSLLDILSKESVSLDT
jgi:dephospho-CoA kinase